VGVRVAARFSNPPANPSAIPDQAEEIVSSNLNLGEEVAP
jgi:hypothetical protein